MRYSFINFILRKKKLNPKLTLKLTLLKLTLKMKKLSNFCKIIFIQMISLILKPVNSLFVVTWVKLSGTPVDDLNLVPYNQHHVITNQGIIYEINRDFQEFRQSNLSMEEYFMTNILIAKKQTTEKFILQRNSFSYEKVRFCFEQCY